jgi:hypothetical protein
MEERTLLEAAIKHLTDTGPSKKWTPDGLLIPVPPAPWYSAFDSADVAHMAALINEMKNYKHIDHFIEDVSDTRRLDWDSAGRPDADGETEEELASDDTSYYRMIEAEELE